MYDRHGPHSARPPSGRRAEAYPPGRARLSNPAVSHDMIPAQTRAASLIATAGAILAAIADARARETQCG